MWKQIANITKDDQYSPSSLKKPLRHNKANWVTETYTKPNLANWLLSGTIRSKILSCGQSVLGSGGRACVPKHYGYYPEISGADTGRLERKMWLLNVVRAAGNRW